MNRYDAQLCVRAKRPSALQPGALVPSLLGALSTRRLGQGIALKDTM